MKKGLFIFLLSLLGIGLAGQALALTVISPVLEMEIEPGQTQSGLVKVYNESLETLSLVSTVEPFTANGETGQPKYLAPETKDSFLKWFNVSKDSLVLRPHEVILVPFKVSVPPSAVPGGYYGVIFWQTVNKNSGQGQQIGINSKVGTLIFLEVKGDLKEAGQILEFKTLPEKKWFFALPIGFSVRFENQGNIHLAPSGKLILKNWVGQTEIIDFNPTQSRVLPASIRRFEILWGNQIISPNLMMNFWSGLQQDLKHLAWGRYTANLVLNYGSANQQSEQLLSFWLIPWHLLVCLSIVVMILIFILRINHRVNKLKKSSSNINHNETKE